MLVNIGAKTRYNLRVVETLTAARILARRLGLAIPPTWRPTLREVFSLYIARAAPSVQFELKGQNGTALSSDVLESELRRILEELEEYKEDLGGEEGLTIEEMIELSGLGEKEFKVMYLDWVDGEVLFSDLLFIRCVKLPHANCVDVDDMC